MQRKPGFPAANCGIKMPECTVMPESMLYDDDIEQQQRRQQLINFGHSQWGFNNWNWTVSKQELDFVDFSNGKYCAGVVAFVNVTVKSFDIHRENIGYATSVANNKGFAIYKSRKSAVTNALRETLLSFGGNIATELTDLLESNRGDIPANAVELENNQNVANKLSEPKNMSIERAARKDSADSSTSGRAVPLTASPGAPPACAPAPPVSAPAPLAAVKNARVLAATLPPANRVPPRPPAVVPPPVSCVPPGVGSVPPGVGSVPQGVPPGAGSVPPGVGVARPNSNVSFVLQPVMPYPPPRLAAPTAPHVFPNAYYEYPAGWHFAYESYERQPGNVNLNFNLPPKNLVVNGRTACRPPDDVTFAPPPPAQGCWIKPTIFYDGFWTEQKVKKWVAEQVEKQYPEDASAASSSPANDKT